MAIGLPSPEFVISVCARMLTREEKFGGTDDG